VTTYLKKAELLGKGDKTNKYFQSLFKEGAKMDEMRETLEQMQKEQEEPCKYQQLSNNFIDSITLKRVGPVNVTPAAKRATKSNNPSQSHTTTPTTQSDATMPTTQAYALSGDSTTTTTNNATNVPRAVDVCQLLTTNKPAHDVTVMAQ
jgi:BRCT domain type II-containing protein